MNSKNISVADDLHIVQHLHEKLKKANKVCYVCGNLFGSAVPGGTSTFHYADCDVCGRVEVPVTEPRDYGYLIRGIMHLERRMAEDAALGAEAMQSSETDLDPLMQQFLKTCDKAGTPVENYESR